MLRRLVIFFLLFWLPLQGWGASVMPFSGQGGVMWMTKERPCCPYHHDSTPQTRHDCGLCHLANAPVSTVVAHLFSPIAGVASLPAVFCMLPDSVPDPLYRPPRA